jgi:hypothetical protein
MAERKIGIKVEQVSATSVLIQIQIGKVIFHLHSLLYYLYIDEGLDKEMKRKRNE